MNIFPWFFLFIIFINNNVFASIEFDLTDTNFVVTTLFDHQNSTTYDLVSSAIYAKFKNDSHSAEANNLMGVLNLGLNNLTQAIYYFKRACEFNQFKFVGFINNLSNALNRLDIETCAAAFKEYIKYLQLQYICSDTFRDHTMKSNIATLYEAVLKSFTNKILSWNDMSMTSSSADESYVSMIYFRQQYVIQLNSVYMLALNDSSENYKLWQLYVAFHHYLYTTHTPLFEHMLISQTIDHSIHTNSSSYVENSTNYDCYNYNCLKLFHLLDTTGLSLFPHSYGLLYIRGSYLLTIGVHTVNINNSATDHSDSNSNSDGINNNSCRNNSATCNSKSCHDRANIFTQAIEFLKAALENLPLEPEVTSTSDAAVFLNNMHQPTAQDITTAINQAKHHYSLAIGMHDDQFNCGGGDDDDGDYSNNSTGKLNITCSDNIIDSPSFLSNTDIISNTEIWRQLYKPPYLLHLGCSDHNKCVKSGYIVQDVRNSISTHIVGKISYLTEFPDQSVGELYSSHTLEHLSHHYQPNLSIVDSDSDSDNVNNANDDLSSTSNIDEKKKRRKGGEDVCSTLIEWRRVMVTGGRLRVSVPDTERLFAHYIHPQRSYQAKALLMLIIYGGQDYEYNYHKTGFHYENLKRLLISVGFCNISRVDYFQEAKQLTANIDNTQCSSSNSGDNTMMQPQHSQQQQRYEFKDTSIMYLFGDYISINVQAYACDNNDNDQDGVLDKCLSVFRYN